MAVSTDKKKISQLMSRRVAETIVEDSLRQRLEFGKPLRVKFGADPTAPDLHLGHVVPLKKLREYQDLGHQVVFIIGDYTAQVGDPSGKSKTRPPLSAEDAKKNGETYLAQVGKILDRDRLEIRWNSEWFGKMQMRDIIKLTSQFTVARIIERDDFTKRLKGGIDIHMHELLYPMMQAYDSIMVDADIELGATDQKFNILAGRDLQRKMDKPEQDVMLIGPLLVGTDGKKKMSKSLGNYIGIAEPAAEMYGKIMSIPDTVLWDYFTLVTDVSEKEIGEMRSECDKRKMNPRDAKARLAREIVTEFHSEDAAKDAEEEFDKVFRQGGRPDEIPEHLEDADEVPLVDVLVNAGLCKSKTEARKVIEQGGVRIDDDVAIDVTVTVEATEKGVVIQKGKRHFIKVRKKS
ncbi:MAG: tyrosine--tRNA ligase [Patescibacteria group bacterium]|nr:tyrosine--tRNA ligase [Patescibacteria group bacterium]